ncbi:MAG: STAS domain-containing protein [Gallionella sp.]|nr:STAS domain-containing protein [Gallionella sp.]
MNAIAQVMQTSQARPAETNAAMQDDQQCALPLAIKVQIRDGSACIAMSGCFDYKTWRIFTNAYLPLLDNAALSEICVDMVNVDYLDSSAMGMLLLLNERAQASNKRVALHITSNFVLRAFEFARFSKVFNVKCSVLASCQPGDLKM